MQEAFARTPILGGRRDSYTSRFVYLSEYGIRVRGGWRRKGGEEPTREARPEAREEDAAGGEEERAEGQRGRIRIPFGVWDSEFNRTR